MVRGAQLTKAELAAIGFHAPAFYLKNAQRGPVSEESSRIVATYMSRMGYKDDFIKRALSVSNELTYLSRADVTKLGVQLVPQTFTKQAFSHVKLTGFL